MPACDHGGVARTCKTVRTRGEVLLCAEAERLVVNTTATNRSALLNLLVQLH